jgi:hypothetical protein
MSAWAQTPRVKQSSLLDIMSEELVHKFVASESCEPVYESFEGDLKEEVHLDAEQIDEDLALALALQEIEDYETHGAVRNQNGGTFTKVSVMSPHQPNVTDYSPTPLIQSSDRYAAELLGAQLETYAKEGGVLFRNGVATLPDGTFVSKHDLLIDGLQNGITLSEIDGVGDLDHAGLMVMLTDVPPSVFLTFLN